MTAAEVSLTILKYVFIFPSYPEAPIPHRNDLTNTLQRPTESFYQTASLADMNDTAFLPQEILKDLRQGILGALGTSLAKFTQEAGLDPTRRQDANTTSRVNLMLENGQTALRNLTVFFCR